MTRKKSLMYGAATIVTAMLATSGLAQQQSESIPQSGSFRTQAGFKDISIMRKVDDTHSMGSGIAWGVAFNDTGKGMLNMSSAMCPHFTSIVETQITESGTCTWSEGNDKIFTHWSAKGDTKSGIEGDQTIDSGTGKFAGIEGKAPFKCHAVSAEGQVACATDWTYQIVATGSSAPPSK